MSLEKLVIMSEFWKQLIKVRELEWQLETVVEVSLPTIMRSDKDNEVWISEIVKKSCNDVIVD